jgi:hypothetical protein
MSYVSEVSSDSPVAWWRCKEASGFLQDSSGNARHADEVHGSPTYLVSGPISSEGSDTAITLHGTGPDWWHIPYNAAFDIGDTFTVEAWIKRGDTSSAEEVIMCRDQGFYIGIITNQLMLARTSVASICKSTTTITDTTTWHHIVNTKTGATCKQYIDAVDVTGAITNSTCTNGTTPPVTIGADGGGEPFTGSIDEVAVYSTVLSAARVSAHYTAATAGGGGGGASGNRNLLLTGVG